MKISELRAWLEVMQRENGDVEVGLDVAHEVGGVVSVQAASGFDGHDIAVVLADRPPPFAPELADEPKHWAEPDHYGPVVIEHDPSWFPCGEHGAGPMRGL